jgi:ABC-type transport system substrate-binding protein
VGTASGASGNAATRLEPFVTKNGACAYGTLPEVDDLFRRQARELDRAKREKLLQQLESILHDQVVQAPIYHNGFSIAKSRLTCRLIASALEVSRPLILASTGTA